MRINWFPGHMNKARREIGEAMPRVDIVLELLDARVPHSSENPLIESLRGETPTLKVLNKQDLADPVVTEAWLAHMNALPGVRAVALDQGQPSAARALVDLGRGLLPADRSKERPIMAMIVGVPNVGKSTLLNTLSGRTLARTGNVPALTRIQQRVRVGRDLVVVDTPGFLWPRLDPPACGYRLAMIGAVRETVLDGVDLARFVASELLRVCPEAVAARYGLDPLPMQPAALIDAIGLRRGCLAKGGVVHVPRASELLIAEARKGLFGRVSFERPDALALDVGAPAIPG